MNKTVFASVKSWAVVECDVNVQSTKTVFSLRFFVLFFLSRIICANFDFRNIIISMVFCCFIWLIFMCAFSIDTPSIHKSHWIPLYSFFYVSCHHSHLVKTIWVNLHYCLAVLSSVQRLITFHACMIVADMYGRCQCYYRWTDFHFVIFSSYFWFISILFIAQLFGQLCASLNPKQALVMCDSLSVTSARIRHNFHELMNGDEIIQNQIEFTDWK